LKKVRHQQYARSSEWERFGTEKHLYRRVTKVAGEACRNGKGDGSTSVARQQ